MNKTLYCAISSHGFGHIAQSVPVLNRLHELRADIKIVIQCDVSHDLLRERLNFPFEHIRHDIDFGMLMKDALTIDARASHKHYNDVHDCWPDRVTDTARLIKQYNPALVYSNISYLANAAAAILAVPVVNLCSLSWYHIYKNYCATMPGAQRILDDMLQAYNTAEVFLAPEPSMPMAEITYVKAIGTIAMAGQDRAADIRAQYNLPAQTKLILVSHGGVSMPLALNDWPHSPDICYLVRQHECPDRPDFIAYESLSMPYLDISCSCDTIICKSGYGTYAEAACNGVSLLYTRRPDWPEDVHLVEWLQQHAHCLELSLDDLQRGDLHEPLQQVASLPRTPLVEPVGIEQAVETLMLYL